MAAAKRSKKCGSNCEGRERSSSKASQVSIPQSSQKSPVPTPNPRFSSNIVTVVAGSGAAPRTFSIHEDIINNSSHFFRAALEKNWKERKTRKINLPDDTSEVVASYVDWCYTQEIAFKDEEHTDPEEEFDLLAKLYVFGDKNQDTAFCSAVVLAMRQLTRGFRKFQDEDMLTPIYPGPNAISIIYQGTPGDCAARRVLVDLYVATGAKDWLENDEILNIPEFLRDLAIARLP